MTRHRVFILLSGLAAGVVFALSRGAPALIYLPFLPLLLLGLAEGNRAVGVASLLGTLITIAFADLGDAVFFLVLIALPSYGFVRGALRHRGEGESREWYPVIKVLSDLAILACAFFMIAAILTPLAGGGSLQAMMAGQFASQIKSADPQLAHMMRELTGEWSFLLFAAAAWMWVLMIYAFAVLANSLLIMQQAALRKSIALTSRGVPGEIAALLAASGILAFLPMGTVRFESETVFLILLLPYFLSGLATLHAGSKQWWGRGAWLALFYTLLILQGWPALLPIAAGLYNQLAEMLDRHGEIG